MDNYIIDFLERNKNKPFITNLKKYSELTFNGRLKCISSLLTHIFIDSENGIDNQNMQEEILSILMNMVLYKQENFLRWLEEKIND